jgi:hypothetical protein
MKNILNKFGIRIMKTNKLVNNNYNQQLEQRHIKNIKILANREKLLEYMPKNGIVAELGVDQGDFTHSIYNINKPKKLYLIDTWESERYNQNKMLFVIKKDSIIALKTFNNNYFDWIYIDTSHTYEQTLKELEISRLKIKKEGIISGHDYCQGNITKNLSYGVIRAVNQFCIKYNYEMIYLTLESHGFLSFAIKKIN